MTEVRPDFLPAMGTPGLLPFYDRFGRLTGMAEHYWRLVAQAAIAPGAAVLDIGCGTGEVALRAAAAVPSATVTGIDPDGEAVALAGRKAAERGLTARFEQAYSQHLPLPDGSVDRVLSSLMYHHLPDDVKVATLAEVRRVLAPGGSLHVLDIDGDHPEWSGWLKPVRGAFGLLQRVAARRGGGHQHGGGHHHGHGHGHGGHLNGHGGHADGARPAHSSASTVLDQLRAAGFTDVAVVGHAQSGMGRLTFVRAGG